MVEVWLMMHAKLHSDAPLFNLVACTDQFECVVKIVCTEQSHMRFCLDAFPINMPSLRREYLLSFSLKASVWRTLALRAKLRWRRTFVGSKAIYC